MKQRKYVLIVLLIGISVNLFAQKEGREANYHYKAENYYVAVNLFEKLYKTDTTNENTIFRYADCLIKCKQNAELAVVLLTKLEANYETNPQWNFNLGLAYIIICVIRDSTCSRGYFMEMVLATGSCLGYLWATHFAHDYFYDYHISHF